MTTTEILTGIKNWVVGKLTLKQDVINDLASIRSGAQAGSTSVQPADILSYFDNAAYDSGTHRINFYHGQSVIAYIDASPFIVDGMVDDVRIENGYLVIDFNTASGKQDISIPLTDIFNPNNYYTKSETDSHLTQKQTEIDDLYARIGYYVCSTEGNVAAKTIVANNYTLGNGGSIKIKMTNANTVNNATLNINSTGAKALYYDGERASSKNSWEAGETVEVYYDGTSFYANNVAGGSGSGDGAFDVSVKYPTSGVDGGNTYTLEGALAVLNANLSASKKKGGMSIKFIHSSDNKYVQYRYMGTSTAVADFTNVANWQGIAIIPIEGSKDLVESGGVFAKTSANKVAQSIGINKRFDLEFVQQKRIGEDGSYSSKGVSANVYASPEYIPVKESQSLYLKVYAPGATDVCAWYDEDFNFVSSFRVKNNENFPRTVTVPSGCRYLRVSNEYPNINEPYVELKDSSYLSNKELQNKMTFLYLKTYDNLRWQEKDIISVVDFCTVVGDVSKDKKYVIREITRNRNGGYEFILSEIDNNGDYVGELVVHKIPTSNVTENEDVTVMVFGNNFVKVIIGIRYGLIENGGIINAYGNQTAYINPVNIVPNKDEKTSLIRYIFNSNMSEKEKILYDNLIDIQIKQKTNTSVLWGFRQMTRKRNGGYEVVFIGLDETGGQIAPVVTIKVLTENVVEHNGIAKIHFENDVLSAEMLYNFNSIEEGGIVSNYGNIYHCFINPIKVSIEQNDKNPLYPKSIMLQNGATIQIYPKYPVPNRNYPGQVTPKKRYISFGFDDFRASDFSLIMPIFEKYGYKATFNKIVNSLGVSKTDKEKIDNLMLGLHELGNHTFMHQQYIFTDALFNGQDPDSPDGNQVPFPSNAQMRDDRGDGKNIFGVALTSTVKSKLSGGPSAIDSSTIWSELTDAECQLIREHYSVMFDTATNVINILDTLWNEMNGGAGSSRGSWDSTTQKYTGGIFAGKSSSANNEIWERVCLVTDYYYKKYLNLNYNIAVWSLPGDKRSNLYYESDGKYYYDLEHTQYANYNAQINGRSWTQVLRDAGYNISHDYFQPGQVDGTGQKAIWEQFILNTQGRRKDGLLYCSSKCHDYVYTEIETAYNDDSTYKTPEDLYDSQSVTVFKRVIEDIRRKMSNGLIPMETTDSSDTYSMKIFYLCLLAYCKATGVEVLTRSEALDLAFNHTFGDGNLIYNPMLKNTAKEFMPDADVPSNPDGYNGQCSVSTDNNIPVLTTTGQTIYLHYGIPTGSIKYSADVLGTGSISIYAIKNSTARDLSDATLMDTITINNVDYSNEDTVLNIPNNPLTQYEQIYEGYGNKIIGIKIVYSAGLSVKNIVLQRT